MEISPVFPSTRTITVLLVGWPSGPPDLAAADTGGTQTLQEHFGRRIGPDAAADFHGKALLRQVDGHVGRAAAGLRRHLVQASNSPGRGSRFIGPQNVSATGIPAQPT